MNIPNRYPTAFCKECNEPIYNSEGTVGRKGFWTCKACFILKGNRD